MKLIEIAQEKIELDRQEIINAHCPHNIDKRFPSYDLVSFVNSNVNGCRGLTCEQCWNMDELELEDIVKSFENKKYSIYDKESEDNA